jgi:hypothetical protein
MPELLRHTFIRGMPAVAIADHGRWEKELPT